MRGLKFFEIALKEKCTLNLALKQIILVKSVDSCGLE